LCSSDPSIKRHTINILEYLLRDPDNRLIIESQGFLPYLFYELVGSYDPAHAMQLVRIIIQLPLEEQTTHHVICDLCGKYSYVGLSYKCLVCNDWDYCAVCYCLSRHSRNHIQVKMQHRNYHEYVSAAQNIVRAAAKLEINEESKTHHGFECAGCGLSPIHGVRYICFTCGKSSLCQKCESKHSRRHCFLKFRYPFKDISILGEDDRRLLTECSGVVPQDAYRHPSFFPTIVSTLSPEEHPFQLGPWILFLSSSESSFKCLPPITVNLTHPTEDSPLISTSGPTEVAENFEMVLWANKIHGKMSNRFVDFMGKDISGLGEREGNGFRGYIRKVRSVWVFKMRKAAEGEGEVDENRPLYIDSEPDIF